MLSQEFIKAVIDNLVEFSSNWLIPIMGVLFICGVILRLLIYYTVKREDWFIRGFESRVEKFLESSEARGSLSFFLVTKKMLEKSYYELFENREIRKRRKSDEIMTLTDRIFLVKEGCAWMVKDTLKQLRYIKHEGGAQPKFLEMSRSAVSANPCFNRVFGIIPASFVNDILNIAPGLFIVGGIFGTFLGIMRALPELGGMDLVDIDGTKVLMDKFLLKISFSMSTSIVGIIFSVLMSLINAAMSPEKIFVTAVDRLDRSLDMLWGRSDNNQLPENIPSYHQTRDPLEALAETSIEKFIVSGVGAKKRNADLPQPKRKKTG